MLTSLVDAVLFMLTKCSVFPALFVFYLFSFVVRVCAHSVQTLGKIKLEIEQPVHYILSLSQDSQCTGWCTRCLPSSMLTCTCTLMSCQCRGTILVDGFCW